MGEMSSFKPNFDYNLGDLSIKIKERSNKIITHDFVMTSI